MRWDFWYPFNCKFTEEYSSKKILKSVKNWQNYGHESVRFFVFWPTLTFLIAWFFNWTGLVSSTTYRLTSSLIRCNIFTRSMSFSSFLPSFLLFFWKKRKSRINKIPSCDDSAPVGERSIVLSMSVCLSVHDHISGTTLPGPQRDQ